jgi:hypothetical protein
MKLAGIDANLLVDALLREKSVTRRCRADRSPRTRFSRVLSDFEGAAS